MRRYVGDRDGTLDVVQETFVAAWKALQRYDRNRSFPVWLRTIALNKCRDRARRRAVRRAIFGGNDADALEAEWVADYTPGPEETMSTAEDSARLHAAIAGLPVKLKESLLLTYFEGFSHLETAEFLSISVKAVETRLYRARQKLAAVLRSDKLTN